MDGPTRRAPANTSTGGGITLEDLRCCQLVEPVGIDVIDPTLSWRLQASRRGAEPLAYQVLVASSPQLLLTDCGDLWDSGEMSATHPPGLRYAGTPLTSRTRCWWKVRAWDNTGCGAWSTPSSWEMGLLEAADWRAEWIGAQRDEPHSSAAPHLRTTFALSRKVLIARAYVSALGMYELHCNGRRVGVDLLRPGWTDYDVRIPYQVYDLTPCLHEGSNAVGVVLADGWYAGAVGPDNRRQWGQAPEALVQLEITTVQGDLHFVSSGSGWRTAFGPILRADLQDGETHDARRELLGWDTCDYDDSGWRQVVPGRGPRGRLVAARTPPVRALEERPATTVTSPATGVWILDLGQNVVGRCRVALSGEPGDTVTLRHGEMLAADGTLHTANLRGARATDQYTLNRSAAVWEPRFTVHGFRYVELTGLRRPPLASDVTGVVVGSALPTAGSFTCSHPLVDQLQRNIVWSQRGNFLEVPTDCPQRDERLGWLGDAQVFAPTAAFNMDVTAFFGKWLQDVRDAQLPSGAYRDVAPPFPGLQEPAAPGWGDAGVLVPWAVYQRTGDVRILEEHYSSMSRWLDHVEAANPSRLWLQERGNDYGDWLSVDADSPKDVVATAWWAHSTGTFARIAAALGRTSDAGRYSALAAEVRRAFAQTYVSEDGQVRGGTQTCYALALDFDLLKGAQRAGAGEHLAADVERHGHLTTGFLGVAHLLPALTSCGRLDLAYRLLLEDSFPSWGYPIRQGATTIWERWDGWTPERGFHPDPMNSFNHYAYGAVGSWLYQVVGGVAVDPDRPGHRHTIFHPRPGGGIRWARTEHRSSYGLVSCAWEDSGDGAFRVELVVPPGSDARVVLPARPEDDVREGGRPVAGAEQVQCVSRAADQAVMAIGSGTYRFEVSPGTRPR